MRAHDGTQLVQIRFGAPGLEAAHADGTERCVVTVIKGGADTKHALVVFLVVERVTLLADEFKLTIERRGTGDGVRRTPRQAYAPDDGRDLAGLQHGENRLAHA